MNSVGHIGNLNVRTILGMILTGCRLARRGGGLYSTQTLHSTLAGHYIFPQLPYDVQAAVHDSSRSIVS